MVGSPACESRFTGFNAAKRAAPGPSTAHNAKGEKTKMVLKLVLLGILFGLSGYCAEESDAGVRTSDTLAAVLQWEILWGEYPNDFRVPTGGTVEVAIYSSTNALSYCSEDLGVCVEYRIQDNRNWLGTKAAKYDHSMNDLDAVLKFAGMPAPITGDKRPVPLTLGAPNGLGGLPSPGGSAWRATLKIKARDQIVREYRQLHPEPIRSLEQWLRQTTSGVGYKSMTIACFAPSDPEIFVYGDRPKRGGPVVFSVIWDRESQEWLEASLIQGADRLADINKLRSIIEAIPCATLKF